MCCPFCGYDRSWRRGRQLGVQRYVCLRCGRKFSSQYRRGHHSIHLIRRFVNTNFDTRGSYRRTAKSIGRKVRYAWIYRIVNRLGENCKSPVDVARELHPRWPGFLGLDGKTVRVGGRILVALIAIDLVTQDVVDAVLAEHEDYRSVSVFLVEVRDEIGYASKEAVVDLDPAWNEAVSDVFLGTPIQLYVVHFERVVVRTIPHRKRTKKQERLLEMVKDVVYSSSEDEAKRGLQKLLRRRSGYFNDRKSLQIIRSLTSNFHGLTTRFMVPDSFRGNNRTESVNDKIQVRLYLMRGYKTRRTAWNSLKLLLMHYRFNPFEACKDSRRNGKCPLDFAGIDTAKMDWIIYSQKDPSVLNVL